MNDELLRRISHLEEENRRLKRGALIALLLGACVLLVGAAPSKEKPVRAAAFHVVDSNGTVRAKLTAEYGRPGVMFFDEKGVILSAYCGRGSGSFTKGRLSFRMGSPDCIPTEKDDTKPPF
jgi:hypothetical protein